MEVLRIFTLSGERRKKSVYQFKGGQSERLKTEEAESTKWNEQDT